MRKKFLEKKIKRLQEKIESLRSQALASSDVEEVRSLNGKIEELREEVEDAKEEIEAIEADEAAAAEEAENPVDARSAIPADAQRVNGAMLGSYRVSERDENPLASMEYRQAFRSFVTSGTPIPAELRGEAINTGDTGVAIPMTVMNEVINTVRKRYGNLYSKVRKISVPGGIKIPVGALSASFKWISEATVSPRQKAGDLGDVTFTYNAAEIRVAQTFLSQLLSIDAFEQEIAKIIAIAYMKAMDEGIVSGSGNGAMLGILNDPRVTNTVSMNATQINDWKAWRTRFFKSLPLGYRAGEFIFPVSTVDAYLETMSDSNNNPIFRQATGLEVNSGDAINPNGRFFGHDIALVEPDIIAGFDDASASDVIGIFWQPEEYAINENFGFTMRRYFDEETNEWVNKALCVVDGKILNPTGIYKIVKGS